MSFAHRPRLDPFSIIDTVELLTDRYRVAWTSFDDLYVNIGCNPAGERICLYSYDCL